MKRLVTRGSLVLAAAFAASTIIIAPSGAATPLQSCNKLVGSATITPGLSTKPANQTVTAKMNATSCTPSAKTGGSGALTATLKISQGSCQGLVKGGQVIKNIKAKMTWKNKKTSNMTLTAKTGTGSNATVATITGKVTSNLFAGKAVTTTLKIAVPSSEDCIHKPVGHITLTSRKPLVFK